MSRMRKGLSELKDSLGVPLTPEEQRSLTACMDGANLRVDTCYVEGLASVHEHCMEYLETVVENQSENLVEVEGAMLLVEQLSIALGLVPRAGVASEPGGPLPCPEGFEGRWQFLVTTGGGWPRVQYTTTVEMLEVAQGGQRFRLESKAGPLYAVASGEMAWGEELPGSQGVRCPTYAKYTVSDFRVELLGRSFGLPAPNPNNDLRLFAMSAKGTLALARSSAGGINLMARPA